MTEDGSDLDLQVLHAQVLERRTFAVVEDRKLQPFYEYLRRLKVQLLDSERYANARETHDLIEACAAEIHRRSGVQPPSPRPRDPSQTITAHQLSDYDRRLQEHEERLHEKLSVLSAKHEAELDAFEADWRDVIPERYRRPSKRLMELRHDAYSLAIGGKFDDAQARKDEADALTNRELHDAQNRLNRDYAKAKNRLLATHRAEITQIQETALQQKELLMSLRSATERAFANRLIVMETKRSPRSARAAAPARSPPMRNSGKRIAGDLRLPPLQPPHAD
jgi:hypothetical protein